MKRISDKITIEDIKKWNNKVITILAGTGAGKSHFIKNTLYKFAKSNNKKILMLIHRSYCVDQFKEEIEEDKKTDVIHIKTYQSIESLLSKHKKYFNFSEYQYIVCDEFHYFMSDAAWNKTTDISLNMILAKTHTTRIFMSATGDYMKKYINGEKKIDTIDYKFPIKFKFIKTLTFYMKDETLEYFIENIIYNKNKAIFFIQSVEKAYNLYKKYKDNCLFSCSKSNSYYKYVDNIKINQMLTNKGFEESVLITTSCLDAGVNLEDINIKYVIIDIEDIGSLIQCLGRKRIQNDKDNIELYVKTISNQQLGGKKTKLNSKIKMADFLKEHTVKEYIEEYYKKYDESNIVYDDTVYEDDKGTKKVNELMYFKCKYDIDDINNMLKKGKYGYCRYLAKLFGFTKNGYYNYDVFEDKDIKKSLDEYLNSIVGTVMYQVSDRKELIEKIDVRSDGKQLKKIYNLNGALEEMQLPYRIIEFTTSKIIDGKKKNFNAAWKVEKLSI